jgi:hypothetical protein
METMGTVLTVRNKLRIVPLNDENRVSREQYSENHSLAG